MSLISAELHLVHFWQKAARASHFNADGTSGVLMGARLSEVWDLTWLCDVLVTPHTVVTTDSEPGG